MSGCYMLLNHTPIIIVIGSGFSGSGAIFDYLVGRPDIADPFFGQEFRLLHDPGGITQLHSAIGSQFSVHQANAAIRQFEKICSMRYGISPSRWLYRFISGKKVIPTISKQALSTYVNKITCVEYPGQTNHELFLKPLLWKRIIVLTRLLWRKLGGRLNGGTLRLPVAENEFLAQTKNFLDLLLLSNEYNTETKGLVVNQGGSFWRPVSSTRYFGENRRIVLVSRDPRDIFSEIKILGYSYPGNAEAFCKWYQKVMERIDEDEWQKTSVLHLKFEEFVINFESVKKRIDLFLGLNDEVTSTYEANLSLKNIGIFKNRLSASEQEIISSQLENFFWNQ